MENTQKKEAYQEILKICEKHTDLKEISWYFDDISDMAGKCKNHLTLVEWCEKYGIELSHEYRPHTRSHIKVNEHMSISYYQDAEKDKSEGGGKFITASDDGRQPENEWLLVISFPTGAYIFGDDYDGQKQLFNDFFRELKGYDPDYSDTTNSTLYWKLENSKDIFDDFDDILERYREKNRSELKERKKERLMKELEELEDNKDQS